jgi:hypothetical protein
MCEYRYCFRCETCQFEIETGLLQQNQLEEISTRGDLLSPSLVLKMGQRNEVWIQQERPS